MKCPPEILKTNQSSEESKFSQQLASSISLGLNSLTTSWSQKSLDKFWRLQIHKFSLNSNEKQKVFLMTNLMDRLRAGEFCPSQKWLVVTSAVALIYTTLLTWGGSLKKPAVVVIIIFLKQQHLVVVFDQNDFGSFWWMTLVLLRGIFKSTPFI